MEIGDTSSAEKLTGRSGDAGSARGRIGAEPDLPVPRSPLTGRDTEVSLLRDRWEQAQEGMGQVVSVIGEPGLGKSRLVDTIKRLVMEERKGGQTGEGAEAPSCDQEASIVDWRCFQRFQNTGLNPVSEYLGRFLNFQNQDSTSVRFDRLASHLDECGMGTQEHVALFSKLLFLSGDERYPAGGLTPVREREETFRALAKWLKGRSVRAPILLVVEDLHWVDASTLEFLGQFIAEGLQDRILTVLTFRPEFRMPWPISAHHTSLALNRLTRRQVGDLISKGVGRAVPAALIKQIFERTQGVPLLVEQFTLIVCESTGADPDSKRQGEPIAVGTSDIPATLQELVLMRLDRCGIRRDFAQLAATLGPEFDYEMFAAIAAADGMTVEAELEKLVRADILRIKGRAPNCTYAFKHALLEEALRGVLDETAARRLHEQVAAIIETRFPEVRERRPESIAQHFTEAGCLERAIPYWLEAGLRSREKFANLEAITHFKTGLGLLEKLEPSPERDARELELLGPLGTSYIALHGYAAPEVGPIFEQARALCERAGETRQLFTMLWGTFAYHVVRGNFRLCADLAEDAIRFGEKLQDPGILMEALFLRGLTMFYRGDFRGAREQCARAIDQYDDRARTAYWTTMIGEDSGVTSRCYLGLPLWHLGYADQALHLHAETVALAREINHPFSLEYALHHMAWLCQTCRMGVTAEAAAVEQMRIAKEQGFSFWLASGTLFKAAGLLLQGQIEEGLGLFEQGLAAYRETGAELGLPYYLSILAEAYIRSGRLSDAQSVIDEAMTFLTQNTEHCQEAELCRLRGELLLAQTGNLDSAEECFQRAIQIARRQQSRAWELRATMSLARLSQRQGRSQLACEALKNVYEQFTEGFSTPDLVDAAALLKDLGGECMREDFASGLQYIRSCLPAPMTGNVEVDYRYIPASTLGGDTLGYHWIDEEHLALYLIDVTGHGFDSALLSVSINNVIRSGSVAAADMRRPEQVLTTLNANFQGREHGGKFFTIWYAVYQPHKRELIWSGGGHHPAVLLPAGDREAVLLESSGPMMGVLPVASFPEQRRQMEPGTRLLIFSDGVFEIRKDKNAVWDFPGCVELLVSLGNAPAMLMDELVQHARRLRGGQHLDDDFSIIEARFP